MLGGLSPRLKAIKAYDATITLTRGNTAIAVNQATTYAWTGQHTFSGTTYLNGSTYSQNLHQFSSTVYFYTYPYFWYGSYNYGTFYNYGNMYFTYWSTGAIPFIDNSNYLTYDATDFVRFNTIKRYGWGLATSDNALAKGHFKGLYSCNGTPTPCASYDADSTGCSAQGGCTWGTYGSCYVYNSDQTNCTATRGCLWNAGSPCSDFNGNQMSCQGTSGCTWDPNYSYCSDFNGNQSTCEMTSGCTWNANTCGSYTNVTDCNNASPCNWTSSPCSDFNGDEATCTATTGCTWNSTSCHDQDGTDQPTCETGRAGCTWDAGSNLCNGTYDTSCTGVYNEHCIGDNSNCSGSYISSYTCNGTYGTGCNENYVCLGTANPCSNYSTDSGTCATHAGCVWEQELATYHDGGAKVLTKLIVDTIPTSAAGLVTGQVWSNGGVLTIV